MSETYEGWLAVEIAMPSGMREDDERLDVLSGALFELGAGGIETRDATDPMMVIASFAPEYASEPIQEGVSELLSLVGIAGATVTIHPYAPIDWATHWRQHFHPISFGGRLWVVPTWLEPPVGADHVLRIDPSSAFGTGLHATTAMCLEKIVALSPVGSILDVGTGTGILALAALELGATRAVATDNDPEALLVARENAERNAFLERLVVCASEPVQLGERFSLVVANILAGPLIELASELKSALLPQGVIVLSGITIGQVDDVVRAYEAEGLARLHVETREEWARIDLKSL